MILSYRQRVFEKFKYKFLLLIKKILGTSKNRPKKTFYFIRSLTLFFPLCQISYALNLISTFLFSEFVKEGKVSYKLGYSLGKEYRVSTYNFKEFLAEEAAKDEHSAKNKVKQLI